MNKRDWLWLVALGIGAMVIIPAPSRLTRNFTRQEFETSRDGMRIPLLLYPNVQRLANELQKLRDEVGPIQLMSGYRSRHYNESVGGARESYHILAMAGDIKAPNFAGGDERALHTKVLDMIRRGKLHNGGVGLYVRSGLAGWVHYDVRRNPARWHG